MKIIIGNATLYLGKCEDYLKEIGPVDSLVMDAPYLINTSGGGKLRSKRRNMEKIREAGIDKGFDINIFDTTMYKSIITFCHNDQLHTLLPFFAENYNRHAVLMWRKTNPLPVANRHYVPQIEFYIHAWIKGVSFPVGELKDKYRIVEAVVGKSKYDHPTVKPDIVMDKIIKNVNGETILDPFMGTGSTGIAALKQGKKFIGIEHNPEFFNIACERFFELYSSVEMLDSIRN